MWSTKKIWWLNRTLEFWLQHLSFCFKSPVDLVDQVWSWVSKIFILGLDPGLDSKFWNRNTGLALRPNSCLWFLALALGKRSSFPFLLNATRKSTKLDKIFRGGSRTAATSKMGYFVIIVNGWKLEAVTVITKCSILDVAGFLDPPLIFR